MRPEMTPAAARALDAARLRASRRGATEVRPEDLLHALLAEEDGRPYLLLARVGADPAAVRQTLEDMPAFGPAHDACVLLPLGASLTDALARAREIARLVSEDHGIPTEALLLAVLEAEEVRRTVSSLRLAFEQLEAEVLGQQGPPIALEESLVLLSDAADDIPTARILDANANRAREALRVIEEYCRFVLDDAFLSGELKQLRHDLADALADVPTSLLLQGRETLRDVGTVISTAGEQERTSLLDVVQTNWKRLQEALRSLEEYGKLRSAGLGQGLERLRYRAYTLEREVVLGGFARQRLADARLCVLVAGSQCVAAIDWTIKQAAAGGAEMIQLREKNLSDRDLLDRARRVRRWTREAGVLFIVNDRPDIARLVEADGVHLGQDDMSVKDARRILGPDALIGVSTHDIEQVRQAVLDGASYLGVGPAFPSGTKQFDELPGPEFVRQATAETSLPAFVIGGVNLATIDEAIEAGAQRVAVAQAICQADEPRQVAMELRNRLGE
jgi:thiamine-phosphate pyrophosphorylase